MKIELVDYGELSFLPGWRYFEDSDTFEFFNAKSKSYKFYTGAKLLVNDKRRSLSGIKDQIQGGCETIELCESLVYVPSHSGWYDELEPTEINFHTFIRIADAFKAVYT